MDELEFRRHVYADPHSQDEKILAAAEADPAKKKFIQEMRTMDNQIAQALAVPVPEDLSEKLILRQTLAAHQDKKRNNRIQLATAASLAFVIGLSVKFMPFHATNYTNLGEYALAHVVHEESSFDNSSNKNISITTLNQKMASYNASFKQSFGRLIAAKDCHFNGMKSLHLVFQGKTNPVTVFVMKNTDNLVNDNYFNNNKYHGKNQYFNKANVIIIGDKNESLQQWQEKINNNIQWFT